MKLTLKIAKVLKKLLNGEVITASSAKSALINELVLENILWQKGKHQKSLQIRNKEALNTYLLNQLQINDLEKYISALENNWLIIVTSIGSAILGAIIGKIVLKKVEFDILTIFISFGMIIFGLALGLGFLEK